ncbi:hypothetical protein M3Y99_00732600 [Aphelenchoides fujianensis]|nr:hypothetical protein M3Y99_00732600 [Aphelenchoides fujianensis]
MWSALLAVCVVLSVGSSRDGAGSEEPPSKELLALDRLHRDTCIGLWENAVHLQGLCLIDVQDRFSCDELAFLVPQAELLVRPVAVPPFTFKRALREHALHNNQKPKFCVNEDPSDGSDAIKGHVIVDAKSGHLAYVRSSSAIPCTSTDWSRCPEFDDDDVYVHDLHPPPQHPTTHLERFLVDLLSFRCFAPDSHDEFTTTRIDLVENPPANCTYKESLGKVFTPIGFCSSKKGECGATVPLHERTHKQPLCYLNDQKLDLDGELREHRPLRFIQVARRLVPLVQSTSNKKVVEIENSHGELSNYCQQNLRPLHRFINRKTGDVRLTIEPKEVAAFRKQRDVYYEEELLGYVSAKKDYCGASLPLYHIQGGRLFGDRYSIRPLPALPHLPFIQQPRQEVLAYLF